MNLSDTKMARNRVEWNPLRYNKFELVRVLNWGRPQSIESKRRFLVAPHTGHVSNFRGLKRSPLEPVQLLSGQWRTRKTGVRIQTGHQSGHVSNPLGSPAILGQSGSRARVPGKPPRTRHSGRFKLPLSATVFRLMRAAFDIIRG